jgi:hypothetical protein
MKELEKLKKLNQKLEKLEDKICLLQDNLTDMISPKIELMRKIELDIIEKNNKSSQVKLPITRFRVSTPSRIIYIPDKIEDFQIKDDMTILYGTKYFSGCGDEHVSIKIPTEYLEMSLDEIKEDYTKRFQSEVDSIVKEEEEKILERKKQEFERLKKELEK